MYILYLGIHVHAIEVGKRKGYWDQAATHWFVVLADL